MHSSVISLFFLLLGLLSLVSCRPSVSTRTATAALGEIATIEIIINDNFYGEQNDNLANPPVWTVPSGSAVVGTVINQGTDTHNWAIVNQGVTLPVPFDEGQSSRLLQYGAGMVYGKNHTTLTFTAPEEIGDYLIICTVPGHYPSMQGRLVVQ